MTKGFFVLLLILECTHNAMASGTFDISKTAGKQKCEVIRHDGKYGVPMTDILSKVSVNCDEANLYTSGWQLNGNAGNEERDIAEGLVQSGFKLDGKVELTGPYHEVIGPFFHIGDAPVGSLQVGADVYLETTKFKRN